MGFWDNIFNKFKTPEEYVDALTEKIKNTNYTDKEKILEYLNQVNNPENINANNFVNEEILSTIISKIINYNASFEISINMAKKMFDLVVYDTENKEQIEQFYKYFNLYLNYPNYDELFMRKNILGTIYCMFENKNILLSYLNFIFENNYNLKNINELIDYMTISRQYFVDDTAFYSNLLEITKEIGPIERNDIDIRNIIKKELIKIKEMAGSYNIDEELIQEISATVKLAIQEIEQYEAKNKEIDETLKEAPLIIEEQIKEIIKEKLKKFQSLSDASNKLITENRNSSIKDLNELKISLERTLTEIVNNSLSKIELNSKNFTEEAQNYISIIRELVGYDEELQSKLKEQVNSPEIYIPNNSDSILSRPISTKEKYKLALSNKDSKELYHEKFDEILKNVIVGHRVMLVGPTGAGKSYSIEQISELLNMKMYNLGFVTDEYTSIRGYTDANGRFVQPPFYEPFKYGGICLFEEVDNSESKALLELNKVVGAKGMSPYMFASGEIVTPHPNFRIIAAGNTWGDGGSLLYTAREKLDTAILERFKQIFYDYDKRLEKLILKNYPDMYEFAQAFRKCLEQSSAEEVFSTRKMGEIKTDLDSSLFTLEEIIEDYFFKGKRQDTIEQIYSSLSRELSSNNAPLKAYAKVKENYKGRRL